MLRHMLGHNNGRAIFRQHHENIPERFDAARGGSYRIKVGLAGRSERDYFMCVCIVCLVSVETSAWLMPNCCVNPRGQMKCFPMKHKALH